MDKCTSIVCDDYLNMNHCPDCHSKEGQLEDPMTNHPFVLLSGVVVTSSCCDFESFFDELTLIDWEKTKELRNNAL